MKDIAGRPLLWHTWRRALQARSLNRLVIAAGDEQIAVAATGFEDVAKDRTARAEVVNVFDDLPSGSDRVHRAVLSLAGNGLSLTPDSVVVNIQGDEPLLDPALIDRTVGLLNQSPTAGVATLGTPLQSADEWLSPTCVKMVRDSNGRVLLWTRAPLPWGDGGYDCIARSEGPPVLRHIGLYAYRWWALERFVSLPPSALEMAERLEQLRLLEAGVEFISGSARYRGVAVDTADDLERVRGIVFS